MNSLVKVFSNFKEFYSEINGATLTGAIDVIVVEQPDGEFQCSPFHVRFGKLGVLRSREKVVDIEINGEPVDIHMKLGDSGEAFFVEECPEEDVEELPENLATSPIPTSYFPNKFVHDEEEIPRDENGKAKNTASEEISMSLPLPRRNSIDFSKETAKEENASAFENQVSDFSHRRYTDNILERRNLSEKIKEYTTQKIRQEWAEHEEIFQFDPLDKDKDWGNSTQSEEKPPEEPERQQLLSQIIDTSNSIQINVANTDLQASTAVEMAESITELKQLATKKTVDKEEVYVATPTSSLVAEPNTNNCAANGLRDESKGKKKRRKKSQMKKKNAQRKSSSSSSVGSNAPLEASTSSTPNANDDGAETISISNQTNSSNDESASIVANACAKSVSEVNASDEPIVAGNNAVAAGDESPISDCGAISPVTPTPTRIPDLDIHFFSDTEVTTSSGGNGPNGRNGTGRPSTPIQSDSELEISMREKDADVELLSNSASWKWGELPTPESHSESRNGGAKGPAAHAQAQRNSMLSGMFNFMKKTNKMRKQANDGGLYLSELDAEGMDPEMAAMYFPNSSAASALAKQDASTHTGNGSAMPQMLQVNDDDRESGNGTSLPHSPSSMEGLKSIDSDYEDGKPRDTKYLDFVAMSLCGGTEKSAPTDEEFDRHVVKYSDVCENPGLFASPNLVVRLNGKYYSWAAACPIVMTIITFQRPLSDDAVEQLMTNAKHDGVAVAVVDKCEVDANTSAGAAGQAKRSWWYWRRSQGAVANNAAAGSTNKNSKPDEKNDEKLTLAEADLAAVATQTTRPNSPDVSDNTLSKTDSTLNAENTSAMVENMEDLSLISSNKSEMNKSERFKKSLRLSSEAIKKLELKDGTNEIEFSVTTAYQGTTRCKCYLFRWKHNDKVVISDIDGTITKSDVLGHLLPMVGKDWAQLGVAQLFSKIEQNGYKLLYLSARAIGQARATREYLRSIRQGDVKLPDGPLLLNPTSLISAFHREVIERKPEQFKIACLSDIRDLFPDKQPFYAGYGNRINDVWAYRAVGIPIMRIFTINTKGELKHELTQTFQSSGYINQSLEIDEYFPVLETKLDDDDDEEFDELKFSESDDDDEGDVFSDEYVDDEGIASDEHVAANNNFVLNK